jgi:hypothetical protein
MGTSTITSYVESAAGVGEGGRTGLTSVTTGVLFLLALILAPIFIIIPDAATAPALITVGLLMMSGIKEIDFEDFNVWAGEPSPSLEQLVFTKEGFDCLCDFLADIPDTYRLVVALNQIGEYTAREIAEILGLSIDVVKIRLHRGKVILLQALKMNCKPEDWL